MVARKANTTQTINNSQRITLKMKMMVDIYFSFLCAANDFDIVSHDTPQGVSACNQQTIVRWGICFCQIDKSV